jgi:hypothetical protein
MSHQPVVDQGFLIVEASKSHSETPHVDRTPLDEWSDCRRDLYLVQYTTLTRDIHATRRIRTRNPNKRVAADPRLRQRGRRDPISVTVLKIHTSNKLSDDTHKPSRNICDINCGNYEKISFLYSNTIECIFESKYYLWNNWTGCKRKRNWRS